MDDRHAVGEHVVDGRALARLLDDLAQLLGVVALHVEGDLDLLVAVADLLGQAEDAEQVDVALDGGGDLGEVHAARGGDVGHAGGQAGGQGVQQVLDRRRAVVGADEHGRVVGVGGVRGGVAHLLLGAEEARRSSTGCACRRSSGCWRGTGTWRSPDRP